MVNEIYMYEYCMGRVLYVCKIVGIWICPRSLRQVLRWSGASSIACATCVQEQPVLGAPTSIVSTALLHLLQQRGHGYVLVISTVRDATSYVLLRYRFAMSSTVCQCSKLFARFPMTMSRSRSRVLQTATVTMLRSGLGQLTYLYFACVLPVSAASDSQ